MSILKIKEHEELNQNLLSFADKQYLEKKFNHSKFPKLIEWQLNTLKFKHYVGILPLKDNIIEIFPKIHDEQSEEDSRHMLLDMLAVTRRIRISPSGVASLAASRKPLLEIFIRHFCEELFLQIHKGLIHDYQVQIQNLTVLRGRLLINEHILQNTVHRERLYCQFDEFCVDNVLNRILKASLHYLQKLSIDTDNQKLIGQLLAVFNEVSLIPAAKLCQIEFKLTRLTKRFASVLDWAQLFLQQLSTDVMTGNALSAPTILFDMNKLFEEYVARKFSELSDYFPGITVSTQHEEKFVEFDDKNRMKVKPDLLLYQMDHANNFSQSPLERVLKVAKAIKICKNLAFCHD